MNKYYQELDWNLDISSSGPTIKKWCDEEKGNPRYFQIPIERLCDNFEIYKVLKDKLFEHEMILYKSKFMQMLPGDFMKIHIDQTVKRIDADVNALHYYGSDAMSYAEVATPVEVAVNIPLLNGGDHITRWYKSDSCNVSLRNAPCGPLPSIDLSECPDKTKLVNQLCIEELKLTKPSAIRTDILHNADARHSNKIRWIMSFRIIDSKTKKFISWSELDRLHAIKF
jgi:hypothetical protein